MKKNIYSLSGARTIISKTQSSPIGLMDHLQSKEMHGSTSHSYSSFHSEAPYISEELSKFGLKLGEKDRERYVNSFLKKKVLTIWKGQRPLIKAAPMLPKLLETTIYQNVYLELKPMISVSYHEDFDLPLMPFTLFGWLQYAKLAARTAGKQCDILYWDELVEFFQQCSNLELLNDLHEE
ncbi:hypothetical protein ACFO25_04270 [Paenactinomyces guangxiensis]|uniref:Uncharacterized protein n=1 Tax=Paenactinomyces guangxiensis TaxID=1490290 RepID=A0A7W2A7Y2_9BACL|nr:hypothetical protein [Paenactinomyces guangxiensis]MBA4493594.1 hypothetical protein [Paenactinomyces guangxiensis]MBH8590881.1 hypothetical protein [Paenactinomyces guangxiensis]